MLRHFLRLCRLVARRAESLVVAAKDVQMIVSQLPDLRRQAVDQVAVVGDEEDGSLELLQHRLQHFLGRNIQMIGRLVQQQEIGSLQR